MYLNKIDHYLEENRPLSNLKKKIERRKESADDAFKRNLSDVNGMLKKVKKAIDNTEKKQKADPMNYGFAGSMGYVREQLENIVSFLNG